MAPILHCAFTIQVKYAEIIVVPRSHIEQGNSQMRQLFPFVFALVLLLPAISRAKGRVAIASPTDHDVATVQRALNGTATVADRSLRKQIARLQDLGYTKALLYRGDGAAVIYAVKRDRFWLNENGQINATALEQWHPAEILVLDGKISQITLPCRLPKILRK